MTLIVDDFIVHIKKTYDDKRSVYIFSQLLLFEKRGGKYPQLLNDIFEFIELIELLKSFSNKKLEVDTEYKIKDKMTAKIVQKDGKKRLSVYFTYYSYRLYLSRFECASLAAKFGKILQRCEPWQEQEA